MGDEYMAANKGKLQNIGQQTVNSYTNEYIPTSTQFQITEPPVHRPLIAISELEDANKTLCISKVYGRWIYDHNTGLTTEIGRDNGTYYQDQWVFPGPA